jgi:DNA-binding NtrC family response regulator
LAIIAKKDHKFPPLQDLHDAIRFDNKDGSIWLEEQRMVLLHTAALGAMRKELIQSLGVDYARGLLTRMGSASGCSDAHLAKRLRGGESLRSIFATGPQLHSVEGIVNAEPVTLDLGLNGGSFYGEFIWRNSFEAAEHLRLFGPAKEPICWQLLGYASGYSSTVLGKAVYFKEVECVGKGDACCRIIGKPLDEWEDAKEMAKRFSTDSLSEQLDSLREEVQQLRTVIEDEKEPLQKIVLDSPAIKNAMYMLEKAAETDVTVLMLGETGVGKEVFSQALHEMGGRSTGQFVAVNCAALPRSLIESELFGVDKGAYTGADKSRPGRFERADGGTLFLDELGELSERAQAKLLRVLQTGEFERVGSSISIKVNVRLIAATNANLLQRVKEGSFRADLYYRLNVFPITIPPLRERLADIPGLIDKFINKYNKKYGRSVTGVTDEVMRRLNTYSWPGNIRELENILERGVILSENNSPLKANFLFIECEPELNDGVLGLSPQGGLAERKDNALMEEFIKDIQSAGLSLDEVERGILEAALNARGGNVQGAARLLGISGPQCRYRLKKIGLV